MMLMMKMGMIKTMMIEQLMMKIKVMKMEQRLMKMIKMKMDQLQMKTLPPPPPLRAARVSLREVSSGRRGGREGAGWVHWVHVVPEPPPLPPLPQPGCFSSVNRDLSKPELLHVGAQDKTQHLILTFSSRTRDQLMTPNMLPFSGHSRHLDTVCVCVCVLLLWY